MVWADLLEEILILVLSYLSLKDRKIFGLVCRSWNEVSTRSRSPWLMFRVRSKQMWKFIQPNGVSNKVFPELYNAEIRCSKYGWLLMSRDDYSLFLFNPSDNMMIELPRMEYTYTTISFFHPPTSPHCFIFGISDSLRSTIMPIGMLKLGENKWTSYPYRNKFRFLVSNCTTVLHHGFLYCLDAIGNIGTFNINGQFSQCSWMVYTNCLSLHPQPCGIIKQQFLFKIHGKKIIFAVFVKHDEGKVDVFKLLEPDMKWELVEDLGDKMLFVSNSATFALTAPKKNMANRIHFPMFHGGKGVFYSLDTKKYHSIERDYTNINYYGFKQLPFATWYAPPLLTQELPQKLTSWHP